LANQLNDPVTVNELITEAERLEIMEKVSFVIAECLFTDRVVQEIEANKLLLQASPPPSKIDLSPGTYKWAEIWSIC
jgi:hypothetical protein